MTRLALCSTLFAALTASGCATSQPVYDSRPRVVLSPAVRAEASRGIYTAPTCNAGDTTCGQRIAIGIRRSEVRKDAALKAAVRAIDRADTKARKRKAGK